MAGPSAHRPATGAAGIEPPGAAAPLTEGGRGVKRPTPMLSIAAPTGTRVLAPPASARNAADRMIVRPDASRAAVFEVVLPASTRIHVLRPLGPSQLRPRPAGAANPTVEYREVHEAATVRRRIALKRN